MSMKKFIQDNIDTKISLSEDGLAQFGFVMLEYNGKYVIAYLPSSKTCNDDLLYHDGVLEDFIDYYLRKPKHKYFKSFCDNIENVKSLKEEVGFMAPDEIKKASFIASLGYMVVLNKGTSYDESVFIFEPETMKRINIKKENEIINTLVKNEKNDLSISAIIKVPSIAKVLTGEEKNLSYIELDEYIKEKPTKTK